MRRAALRPQPWLFPLGALWGGASRLRAELYRRRLLSQARLQGPVLSVGNLSVGGSGKTPAVAWLARVLAEAGHPVSVLSRGYGGSFRGECLLVSDGERVLAGADAAGDEPVMLARALPGVVVAVGPARDAVGRAIERRFGPRVHLLDDGFQHLRLARDLDLVCVSPRDFQDRPLPAGFLREPRSALARADVVLLARDGLSDPEAGGLARELGTARTFLVRRRPLGFFTPDGAEAAAPARAFLLSGIAHSSRFAEDVAAAGAVVAGHAAFPDHHRFTAGELQDALAQARAAEATEIVTTEKDLVRLLPPPPDSPARLVLRTALAIEDAERLRALVLAAVGGRR